MSVNTGTQSGQAGGRREKPSSASNSSGSGTKPLRPTMNIFVEIHGQGQGYVTSNLGGINCEPIHCQAVDYSKDFTGMTCDPNYCNGVVDTGSVVTLTPIPEEGSVFKSWGGHPDCHKENRPITGNRLCIAYFGKEED